MLSWLTGGRPDHPMATMKKARQLVAELLGHDSFRVLDECASWLESVSCTEGFKLDYRLWLIDLLDRGAKTHHGRLAQEYLDAPRLQKAYESRLWNTSFGFWKSLGAAYLECIALFQAGAPGSAALKKDLPLVAGRALRALTVQLKWVLLRYALIEERIWRDLGRAYLFAESQDLAAHRAAIYPGVHGESSAQEEFLKSLMLVMSSPGSLSPTGLHIAERTVAHLGNWFSLQSKPAPECHFCFDLSMHKPPARVRKDMTGGPLVRFFGAGDAAHALRSLMGEIKSKDGVPGTLNLGRAYDKQTVLSVLAHLEQYWADKPPVRGAPRRELATRVTVAPGLPQILRWSQAVMDTSSLEFSDPESSESWIVFNQSNGGYGAIVPQVKGEWLKIGTLIGLRPETASGCRVGILRRITRDRYDQCRVGIQVLGQVAVPVTLTPAGSGDSADPARRGAPALLLSDKPDKNGEVALLMRAGSFTEKQSLHMRVHKTYLVAPSALVEVGEEYDWARFKVVNQL